jgi:hypothetical protein
LASSPALLKRLHDDHAAAFAAFGDSLRLRDGVVLPPGDAGAARVWALLAGEAVTDTERFVPALFGRDRGRLAYFYQTVSALDPPRQRFALASGLEHPRLRFEQVAALYEVFQYFDPGWQPTARPFTRRPLDPARWLAEVRVSEEGAWVGPRALRLWDRVFAGDDLSSEASRELEEEEDSGPFAPAWLAAKIFSGSPVQQRAVRRDALLAAGVRRGRRP